MLKDPDRIFTNLYGLEDPFLEAAKKRGLLIGRGGLYNNVIRMAPPMLTSEEELVEGCRLLDEAMAEVQSHV